MTLIPNINSYRCLITTDWVRIIPITTESFDPGCPYSLLTPLILSIFSTFKCIEKKPVHFTNRTDLFGTCLYCFSVSTTNSLTLLYLHFIHTLLVMGIRKHNRTQILAPKSTIQLQ